VREVTSRELLGTTQGFEIAAKDTAISLCEQWQGGAVLSCSYMLDLSWRESEYGDVVWNLVMILKFEGVLHIDSVSFKNWALIS
jgi:hypothetical protein